MAQLLPLLLFLHLVGAIVGLGPTFAFSRIAALGRAEPAHATFGARVVRTIQGRLTVPLALLTLGSGFAMLAVIGYDVLATPWLLVSILLFLSSFGYAVLVQNKDLVRVIDIASAASSPSEAEAAELRSRRARIRYGGLYMRGAVLTILFLMVFKPG